jgi:hypothetical protein
VTGERELESYQVKPGGRAGGGSRRRNLLQRQRFRERRVREFIGSLHPKEVEAFRKVLAEGTQEKPEGVQLPTNRTWDYLKHEGVKVLEKLRCNRDG